MKQRLVLVLPLLVAAALHAWASEAYAQDGFITIVALAAVPLGGRAPLGPTAQRVIAGIFFVIGAGAGWAHLPQLGIGPGTLPRSASLVAAGALFAAVSRLYARVTWTRERATFVLGMLAVAASGATRLGPAYAAFAGAYVFLAVLAMRMRDDGRAPWSSLRARHFVATGAIAVVVAVLAVGLTRAALPLHDAMQRALVDAYTTHDITGFGSGTALGAMRDMIRSDTEVLRIAPPPHSLPVDYLRGAVYDEYRTDGVWWQTPFAERLHDRAVPKELGAPGAAVHVRRVAGTPNRYFIPLEARDVRVVTGAVEADELGALYTVGSERATEYSFVLGNRDELAPAEPRPLDLRLPRGETQALQQLARAWSPEGATAEDKLDAIGSHLAREYRYSLTDVREADDPLLDFLFSQKVGYCTYFASAMVLVARASGVPARLVTGYRVAEWSPFAGELVVREKNAHAWVEAWVNGAWRTYDPTPLVELPQDAPHLASLGTFVADGIQRTEHAIAYALAHVTPAQLLVSLAALAGMWALVRAIRNRRAGDAEDRAVESGDRPLPFFERLVAELARGGVFRDRAEPLDAFVNRLEAAGLADAAALVARYAALRYGGVGDSRSLGDDVERFLTRAAR